MDPVKRSFYAACNCVFSNCNSAHEIVQLNLQEAYCLPLLTYASPAIVLKVKQAAELNACWNSVFRRIFGFNKWESVRMFINGMGRLDLHHILLLRRDKFYRHLSASDCNSLLHDLYVIYCTDNFCLDSCCKSALLPAHIARSKICTDFAESMY